MPAVRWPGRPLDERAARVALSALVEPGDPAVGRAVESHGAVGVLESLVEGRSGLAGEQHYRTRLAGADPEAVLASLDRCGARVVVPGDSEWPLQLDDLGSARPLVLYLRGRPLRAAAVDSVAVVGARAATQYGLHVAADLAAGLVEQGAVVVSGGAYGVDAAAHRGALAYAGVTVAVLACGVDVAYPRGHSALLERIADEGVVAGELPPGRSPTRLRFLSRNRVIAALTRGTVVVEAAVRSGALSTAGHARDLNRVVMGVPGPVTSVESAGVHRLLRSGAAVLVTDADEVLEQVGAIGRLAPERRGPTTRRDALDPTTRRVLEAVPPAPGAALRRIVPEAGLDEPTVSAALRRLLLLGLVRVGEGDVWLLG